MGRLRLRLDGLLRQRVLVHKGLRDHRLVDRMERLDGLLRDHLIRVERLLGNNGLLRNQRLLGLVDKSFAKSLSTVTALSES